LILIEAVDSVRRLDKYKKNQFGASLLSPAAS